MKFGLRDKLKLGSKNDEPDRVFVDLDNYEIDSDRTVMKIKTFDATDPSDITAVTNQISKKMTIVVGLSAFKGTSGEKDAFVDSMRAAVREAGGQFSMLGPDSVLATPSDVKVEKLRRRK